MVTDRDGGVDIDRDRDRDGQRQGWRCRHPQRQTEMVTDRDGGVDIDLRQVEQHTHTYRDSDRKT